MRKFIPKVASKDNLDACEKIKEDLVKILIIYTGGTIGMCPVGENDTIKPCKGYLPQRVRELPQFVDFKYNYCAPPGYFISPVFKSHRRALYHIVEFENLIDSSCMDFENWNEICQPIKKEYENYDAFLILHGTDTMAYTASALSFMLENLNKIVVITGSQIPLRDTRNDAFSNFLGAIQICTDYPTIPEVCVFFNHKLYRGCRVTKMSTKSFEAYYSLAVKPLVKYSVDIKVRQALIRDNTDKKLNVRFFSDQKIEIVFLYPGISPKVLESILLNGETQGALLLSFGAGNFTDKPGTKKYLRIIELANKKNIVMLNVTQCPKGGVEIHYEAGNDLSKRGVLPAYDMTKEAVFTKLIYLFSKYKDLDTNEKIEKVKIKMKKNLRGELTVQTKEVNEESLKKCFEVPKLQKKICKMVSHLIRGKLKFSNFREGVIEMVEDMSREQKQEKEENKKKE